MGDIFVHNSACSVAPGSHKSLAEDEKVEYELLEEQGKSKAHNVTGPGGSYCVGQPRPVDPAQQPAAPSPYGGYAPYGNYAPPQMAQMYGTPPPAQYGGYPQYGSANVAPGQAADPKAAAVYAAYYAQQAGAKPLIY